MISQKCKLRGRNRCRCFCVELVKSSPKVFLNVGLSGILGSDRKQKNT